MKQVILFLFAFITALGSINYAMEAPKDNAIQEINFCDFPEEVIDYIGMLAANAIPEKSIMSHSLLIHTNNSEDDISEKIYTEKKLEVLQYGTLASINQSLNKQFSKKLSFPITQLFYMYLKTPPYQEVKNIFTSLDNLFRENKKFLNYIDFRHPASTNTLSIIEKRKAPEHCYIYLADFAKYEKCVNDKTSLLIHMLQKEKNSGETHLPLSIELTIWKDDAQDENDIVKKETLWLETPKKDSSWCSIL